MSDQTETLVAAIETVLADNGATAPEADTNTLARRIAAAVEANAGAADLATSDESAANAAGLTG